MENALAVVPLDEPIGTLHFAPDGETLVCAQGTEISLWRIVDERPERQSSFPSGMKTLYHITLSEDGNRVAAAGRPVAGKPPLATWVLPDGVLEHEFSFPDSYLLSAVFAPDGARLLAAGDAEVLYVVSLRTGRTELSAGEETDDEDFWGLGERNTSLAYHPDGKTILATACSQSGSGVMFCELDSALGTLTPRGDLTLPLDYDVLMPAVFSPDGGFFAFADWNVKLYSFPHRRLTAVLDPEGQRLPEPTGNPVVRRFWSNAVFTPDGQTLICGSPDGAVFLWDVPGGTLRRTLTGHTGSILWLAVNRSGTRLVSSGRDKTLRLWQI